MCAVDLPPAEPGTVKEERSSPAAATPATPADSTSASGSAANTPAPTPGGSTPKTEKKVHKQREYSGRD